MIRLLALLGLACGLWGCSTDISNTAAYRPGEGKALIVIGIRTSVPFYYVQIFSFDPLTQHVSLDNRTELKRNSLIMPKDSFDYRVAEIQPGHYAVAAFQVGNQAVCLSEGTLEFTIMPNRVNYVGNVSIDWDSRQLSFIGRDTAALTAYLSANFPNASLPINELPIRITTFKTGQNPTTGAPTCAY